MNKIISLVTVLTISLIGFSQSKHSVFLEAESFENKGGWVVDQQFMDLMGSSYLIAHGMGVPVADAKTTVDFPSTGKYNVFIRTFNWTSPWHNGEGSGKFQLIVNGKKAGTVLGASVSEWFWQNAGKVNITNAKTTLPENVNHEDCWVIIS